MQQQLQNFYSREGNLIGRQRESKGAWHEVICAESKHMVFLRFYVTELMKIAMFPS